MHTRSQNNLAIFLDSRLWMGGRLQVPRNTKYPSRLKPRSSKTWASLGIPQIHKCSKFHINRTKLWLLGRWQILHSDIKQDTQTERQTTDRQHFYCSFLVLGVRNVHKKSFSSIGRKRIFETVTIYVLWDSGHIINIEGLGLLTKAHYASGH